MWLFLVYVPAKNYEKTLHAYLQTKTEDNGIYTESVAVPSFPLDWDFTFGLYQKDAMLLIHKSAFEDTKLSVSDIINVYELTEEEENAFFWVDSDMCLISEENPERQALYDSTYKENAKILYDIAKDVYGDF